MNIKNIDAVLQFALLAASGEDDFRDRQLGPIHLIKYVYLADLAYAERHDGETFTGVPWRFYNFGPWASEVHQRIEPALLAINADLKSFPSNYGDKAEWHRWSAVDDTMMPEIERSLPFIVTTTIKRNVHKFGQSTPDLLASVYSTFPMLRAAPDEHLIFQSSESLGSVSTEEDKLAPLSARKRKKLKEGMARLRAMSTEKLAEKRRKRLVKPATIPRYDDVYTDGLIWLDSLAGPEVPEGHHEAVFSDSIWKSPARMGDIVSD